MAGLNCVFFVFYGPCFILQAFGFFSPHWVTIDSCDAVGLFYRCCKQNTTGCSFDGKDTYLNRTVLGLQATSLFVMLLGYISMRCMMCWSKEPVNDPGCCGSILNWSIALYPVAGILSIIGCILLAVYYSTSHLRWGFYLCVTAGCYMLLLTFIMCCFMIRLSGAEENRQLHIQGYGTVEIKHKSGEVYFGLYPVSSIQ